MAMSIFTADEKTIKEDWQSFLADANISSPITSEVTTSATDFTSKPARFFNLKFTTQANPARFRQAGPFINSATKNDVLLGLDSTATWSGTLEDVLRAFIGTPKLETSGVVARILSILAGTVKVSLVNKPDTRNAMWCVPGQTRTVSTALILALDPDTALSSIKDGIQDELGLQIGNLAPLTFHCQRTSYGTPFLKSDGKTAWSVISTYTLLIQVTIDGFDFWFQQNPQGVSVILTQNKDDTTDVWTKLSNLGGSANVAPPALSASPSGPDVLSHVDLLSVSLGRNLAKKLWWEIKTMFKWDASDGGDSPILIGLTYDSPSQTFTGELLTRASFQFDKRLLDYTASVDVAPRSINIQTLPEQLLLSDIFAPAASLPKSIPNAISLAQISYTSTATQSVLGLTATLVRIPSSAEPGATDVPAPFTWDSLAVYAQKSTTKPSTGKKTSEFAFGAATAFALHPREEDKDIFQPALLGLSIDYASGQWTVSGNVQNLQFGVLVSFFDNDPSVKSSILNILSKLTIAELDVLYTYKSGQPSSFLLSGSILLGALELRLFYQYIGATAETGKTAADLKQQPRDPAPLKIPPKGAAWQLRAYLGAANGKKATLGEIIDSIAGKDNGSDVIPDFVKSIMIEPATSGANSAISIEVSKAGMGAIFVLGLNVLGIKFSYIQLSSGGKTTRLLRLAVDKLPLVSSIPLLDKLPQPFDEMLYLYVSGDKGMLQSDMDLINAALDPAEKVLYKRTVAKTSLTNPAPVIAVGHHFMVIDNGDVVLDHVFDTGPSKTQPTGQGPNGPRMLLAPGQQNVPLPSTVSNNAPSKGALTKTLGPLSISGVSLQHKNKVLWIHMDAVLALGPISLGLLGFGIGFLTTGVQLTHLQDIITDKVDGESRLRWELHGMSISFEKPPIMLAGMFEHEILALPGGGGSMEVYKGGVGVGFPPYTFVGVGEYSIVSLDKGPSYKSVFVFAKLDGPLVTLEFATISGVRLGFGFNSVVRSPKLNELTDFPFLKSSSAVGAANNPMAILSAMSPAWVTPKADSYWLAAGMTITAFEVVAITAVAMFAFRDSGVVISIFADAVAQLPPKVPNPNAMILYVEIAMQAEINFVDGYFKVQAAIAPTSFLLVPQCHLTGGFALAYWFGNNPNAGDWVFSVGGYHPAFQPPPYYPIPNRVGISFVIGDNMQMTGQSYFAITPKAAMAGAAIHVSLSVGPVSAYLDASFDALINFHPFHYVVQFSVAVGVECRIDIWFIHIHISIHIGAELHIEGPEFGGIAHVDFWFFGFDIEFGARIGSPPPLELLEFWNTTHKPGPSTSDRQDNDPNPVQAQLAYDADYVVGKSSAVVQPPVPNSAFKFILEDGNFPAASRSGSPPARDPATADLVPSTGAGANWYVKGGSFRFGITTEFALSAVTVSGIGGPFNAGAVYARPMRVTQPISSAMTVTVRRRMVDGTLSDPITGWRDITLNNKPVPTALWAPYDASLDVLARGPRSAAPPDLLDGTTGATRIQALGVSLTAPWPVLSIAKIPKFKASAAAKLAVRNILSNKTTEDWYIPPLQPPQSKFLAAPLTDEEKAMNAPTRWKAVADEWRKAADDGKDARDYSTDGILALAATEVFGWNVKRPVGEVATDTSLPGQAPWLLKGKPAKKLIDGLADFYLALPRICV